jgi:hypothetical protein
MQGKVEKFHGRHYPCVFGMGSARDISKKEVTGQ